jgi:two-component system NarL family sensor kinase
LKTTRHRSPSRSASHGELAELLARVAETDETLRAIRNGEVDTVMGAGRQKSQVFTLDGDEHDYRVLIESMNEGALTLTTDKMILYANQCFARMVKCPLEQVTGSSFRRFLSITDRAMLRQLMKRAAKSGSKIQMSLQLGDGSQLPVQISIRELVKNNSNQNSNQMTIGMVVTDMTDARRSEEVLRNLTHRLMQAQEEEQKRISRELHDVIAQTLTGINIRLATLNKQAALNTKGFDRNIARTQRLVEKSVGIVQQFARELRPTVLDDLGLIPALHSFAKLFSKRTRIHVHLKIFAGIEQLDIAKRTVLFRVAQEALNNVARHAKASRVEVNIQKLADGFGMKIKDNGKSFNLDRVLNAKGRKRLGLLGMRERVEMVGGTFCVESAPGKGTTVRVEIPFVHVRKDALKKSGKQTTLECP